MRDVRIAGLLTWVFLFTSCGGASRASDQTPPTVTSTTPADLAEGVAAEVVAVVVFSEAMDPGSVTSSTVRLVHVSSGQSVDAAVSYEEATYEASIQPAASLLAGAAYEGVVTTDVKDRAGNALASEYTWTFTVYEEPPPPPPTVVGTTPVDMAGGQSTDVHPTVTFSEAMDALTLTPDSITLMDTTSGFFASATVSYDGPSWTATLEPAMPLFAGRTYEGRVDASVTNDNGVPLGADFTWRFSIAYDTNYPTVVSTTPLVAINVPIDSVFTVTFSEPMDERSITTSTVSLEENGNPVSASVTYDHTTNVATLTPDTFLDAGFTTYRLVVTTGARDTSGNSLDAQYTRDFTTVASTSLQWLVSNDGGPPTGLAQVALQDALPYVVHEETGPGGASDVHVRAWDGAFWTELGEGPVRALSGGTHLASANPQLLLVHDTLFLAWDESDAFGGRFVFVASWDTSDPDVTAWTIEGTKLNLDRRRAAQAPKLDWDDAERTLAITFEELVDGVRETVTLRRRYE